MGYLDYRSNAPIVATVWKDKRIIHFLTTIHMAKCSLPITAKRREKDGTQKDVECPPCLPDYQKFMRGIDRGDQMMGYYNVGRRSRKWWKRDFSYLIEVCLLNAYVLHKFSDEVQADFLQFWLDLAVQLIGTVRRQACGRPRSIEQTELLRLDSTKGHFLKLLQDVDVWCAAKYESREVSASMNTGTRVASNAVCVKFIYV